MLVVVENPPRSSSGRMELSLHWEKQETMGVRVGLLEEMVTLEVEEEDVVTMARQSPEEMEVVTEDPESVVKEVMVVLAVLWTCLHSSLKSFRSGENSYSYRAEND